MNLKLNQIEITDLQARAGTDDKTIEEYAEAWKEDEQFPKIICFHDGKNYFLADGFHRYFGARKAGLTEIPADIRKGSRSDALWFAVGANKSHGLRRTAEDKKCAIEKAISQFPEKTQQEISAQVGCSRSYVQQIQSQFASTGKLKLPENRVGSDGKTYPTKKNYPPPPSRPSTKHGPPPASRHSTPLAKPASKPPSARKNDAPKILDKTGWIIPEKILPLWDRSQEVQDLLSDLSGIRGKLKRAQEDKDKLFSSISFSSALAHADQLYADLKTALPYAVCTSCQGQVANSCTLCKGRGFISEFHYDTCVPKETKAIRAKSAVK